jgi:hypothetical protein
MSSPYTAGQRGLSWLRGAHGKERGNDGPSSGDGDIRGALPAMEHGGRRVLRR